MVEPHALPHEVFAYVCVYIYIYIYMACEDSCCRNKTIIVLSAYEELTFDLIEQIENLVIKA